MHVKIEKVAAWSGIGMLLAFLVMFCFIAGVIPPIDPNDSAAEVAARYTEDGLRIRIGLALMVFFAFALGSVLGATGPAGATDRRLLGRHVAHSDPARRDLPVRFLAVRDLRRHRRLPAGAQSRCDASA